MAPGHLVDLSNSGIISLTQLLALPPHIGVEHPSKRWLRRQEAKIIHLPVELQRPCNLMDRLKMTIGRRFEGPGLREFALLCRHHKMLNPYVIRAIFNVVAAEATIKSDRVRHHLEPGDGKRIGAAIERLDALNALWVAEGSWRMLFPNREVPSGYKRVASECEACILASVGARATALSDLRANMISRWGEVEPRLWRVVEGWIGRFRQEDVVDIQAESEELGGLMRKRRKEIRREMDRWTMLGMSLGGGYENQASSSASRRPQSVRDPTHQGSREGRGPEKRESDTERRTGLEERESQMWKGYEREILDHRDHGDEDDDERGQPIEDGILSYYARSQIDLSEEGGMHPAFQTAPRSTYSHPSAKVPPLDTSTNKPNKAKHSTAPRYTTTSRQRHRDDCPFDDDQSWTSVTVHTAASSPKDPAPDVPRVPSQYAKRGGPSASPNKSPSPPSFASSSHLTTSPSPCTPLVIQNPLLDNFPKVDPQTGRVFSGKFHSLPGGDYIPLYAASSLYPSEANQAADRRADNDEEYQHNEAPRRPRDDDDDRDMVVGARRKFRDPFEKDRQKERERSWGAIARSEASSSSRYPPRKEVYMR